jgi:HD-GYP domain-containing protein (c-di-GMP phosphodiesterase class II)
MNPTVGLAARLSLFVGSVAFALSTVRWSRTVSDWFGTYWRTGLTVLGLVWIVFLLVSLRAPDLLMRLVARVGSVPLRAAAAGETPVMALAALALYGLAAGRYFAEWRLSAVPAQATLAAGMVFLGEAQLAMWLAPIWALSWWGYHVLMLTGFLTTVAGFGLSYTRHRSPAGLFEALFLTDPLDRIEASYTEAIVALVAAVEARDRYTKGHSARVSQMAVLIGEGLRLPGSALRSLGRAGLVHDVGKLSIPDAILSKPGRLTAEEYDVVKEHPTRGFEVIGRIASLHEELPGVLHHHEWYDGSGYPHGLRGEEIPLAARILAVADVYDALTSERPYRGALSPDEALAHLRRMAGTQFDGPIVEAFARIEPSWRARRMKLPEGA